VKVELLKAFEEHTWDTEIVDVPDGVADDVLAGDGSEWDAAVLDWVHRNLATQAQHRNVVFWGIYNSNPEADFDDPRLDDEGKEGEGESAL
jgi:hypothetical protein